MKSVSNFNLLDKARRAYRGERVKNPTLPALVPGGGEVKANGRLLIELPRVDGTTVDHVDRQALDRQTHPEAQSINTFYDVALWQKLHAADSRRKGYVETRLGRRWCWSWRAMDPETLPQDIPFRDDLLIGFSKPLSLNFPVQGSASETMALALVNTHRALKGSNAQLLASVHDELVLECPAQLVDEIKQLVADTMTAAFTRLFPEAPINGLVDAASGPSWGELE